ncbi:MAG TPA: hypothetical protein VKG80_12190 [Trebonia sp.]|nr:hypothetical protein [Trebonia sp.]
MDRLVFGVAPDGFSVAECELAAGEVGLAPELIEEAARSGAERLWVHSPADLTASGFQPREGYRRFCLEACPRGEPLPVLDVETIADLWPRAFGGQWGHRHVDAATARAFTASGEAVFVGLREQGGWTGLCRIEPRERRYLGAGPATVETWGEPAAPYLAMGFQVAEDVKGWPRVLGPGYPAAGLATFATNSGSPVEVSVTSIR